MKIINIYVLYPNWHVHRNLSGVRRGGGRNLDRTDTSIGQEKRDRGLNRTETLTARQTPQPDEAGETEAETRQKP